MTRRDQEERGQRVNGPDHLSDDGPGPSPDGPSMGEHPFNEVEPLLEIIDFAPQVG